MSEATLGSAIYRYEELGLADCFSFPALVLDLSLLIMGLNRFLYSLPNPFAIGVTFLKVFKSSFF